MTPVGRLGHRGPSRSGYRFLAFGLAGVLVVSGLAFRMFALMLLDHSHYEGIAAEQSSQLQAIPSERGLIYDDQGRLLVLNVASYAVTITPAQLPLSEQVAVTNQLGKLLGIDPIDIRTQLGLALDIETPVLVATNVPENLALIVDENTAALPGVHTVVESSRQYTDGSLFGQLLGYTAPITAQEWPHFQSQGYQMTDWIGQSGLEAEYETQLRGRYGTQQVAVNAAGAPVSADMVTPIAPAIPGDSLHLTIDAHEQELAHQALEWGLQATKVPNGVIIVMNPQNGQILAMDGEPGYDDNLFARGISPAQYQKLVADPNAPLVNKAIATARASGSTFKLVTGSAGLQGGVITDHSIIETAPYIQLGAWKFWDWNRAGFGPLNIYGGYADSSDTFFYQLAERDGLDRLTKMALQYGFGARSGIDLPGETSGIVPTNDWKMATFGQPVYPGELALAGIGQGYDAVTPIQLINAYAALANGGRLYQPQLVKDITDANGKVVESFAPKLIRQVGVSAKNLEIMRVAARDVVTSGHTMNLDRMPIEIAGKTGTAEFGVPDQYGRLPYDDLFVGFTPADPYQGSFAGTDSQLIVLCWIQDANSLGNVATEVVKYYMALHYKLPGNPFSSSVPWHIESWAPIRADFAGSAGN